MLKREHYDHLVVGGGFFGAVLAAELARGAPRPEQVAALQARVAMQDKRFDTALAALAALPPGLEHALATDVQGWGTQAALGAVNAGQAAQARVKPIYETIEGWTDSTAGARSWGQLPAQAIKYVRRIEELIGASVAVLSTSPERDDTILVRNPFEG